MALALTVMTFLSNLADLAGLIGSESSVIEWLSMKEKEKEKTHKASEDMREAAMQTAIDTGKAVAESRADRRA
jgi:hypothetical protein